MESVTELFPGKAYRTRVYATADGHKDYQGIKYRRQAAKFERRCEAGFEGYKVRTEGKNVVAFGKNGDTERIAGFFDSEPKRRKFVVVGVWEGKPSNKKRPPGADTIVARAEGLKEEGVIYVDTPQSSSGPSG